MHFMTWRPLPASRSSMRSRVTSHMEWVRSVNHRLAEWEMHDLLR